MRVRILVWVGLVLGFAAPARALAVSGVLIDQTGSGTQAFTSYDFASPAAAAYDNQAADDFNVPAGEAWRITSLDVYGTHQGPAVAAGGVFLYASSGTAPGSQLFEQLGIPVTITGPPEARYGLGLSGAPSLMPGTYWLSVRMQGPGTPTQAWKWEILDAPLAGNQAVWQNPGNAAGTGCTAWKPLGSCANPPFPVGTGQDLFFRLTGDLIDSRFSLGHFKRKPHDRIALTAKFPTAGIATVQDASTAKHTARAATSRKARPKIKRVKLSVAGGSRSLPIKLTRSAKKRLASKPKLKVKVKVTFAATGGAPFSQTARLTVHQG